SYFLSLNIADKTDDNESLSAAGRKRKAANTAEVSESAGSPVFTCWLMKSEPESRFENGIDVKFGIEDLKALPNQTGCWDGVRNYQVDFNSLINIKSHASFHLHFFCFETMSIRLEGIVGLMLSSCFLDQIVKEAYVDHTQFDKKDVHYDASSKPDNPKWSMVDVQFQRMMKRFLPLSELKKYHLQHRANGGPLKDMALFTRARLSVQPLTSEEFDFILSLEDKEPL
uniref:Thymocyte nuclear protein 1 n=1 Tax=Cyprinodon variegatus TaxID=28743 RepID=A0A3Q2CB22_CYPVA